MLTRLLEAQSKTLGTDAVAVADVEKRVATIEDLLVKVLKTAVVLTIVVVILGVFDLWSVLAGLGIVIAAITLAGQNIVLDYLMGILILVEGQYYKGDVVRINAVEGTVEEVGLRRTLVRDVRGTLHSISNGEIRTSANLTRTYAVAMVAIDGVPDHALEAAITVLEQVGRDLAADPALEGRVPRHAGLHRHDGADRGGRDDPHLGPGRPGAADAGRGGDAPTRRRRDGGRGDRAHPPDVGAAPRA